MLLLTIVYNECNQLTLVVTEEASSSACNLQLKQIVIINPRTERFAAFMFSSDYSKSV